ICSIGYLQPRSVSQPLHKLLVSAHAEWRVRCGAVGFLTRSERRADAIDLAEMQEIVPGVEPDHVIEAFFSSLGVDADALKIGVGGLVEQAEVGAAQHAE